MPFNTLCSLLSRYVGTRAQASPRSGQAWQLLSTPPPRTWRYLKLEGTSTLKTPPQQVLSSKGTLTKKGARAAFLGILRWYEVLYCNPGCRSPDTPMHGRDRFHVGRCGQMVRLVRSAARDERVDDQSDEVVVDRRAPWLGRLDSGVSDALGRFR